MCRRISIWGRVRRSVGRSVRPSVGPSRVIFEGTLGASCAVYPALFIRTPIFPLSLNVHIFSAISAGAVVYTALLLAMTNFNPNMKERFFAQNWGWACSHFFCLRKFITQHFTNWLICGKSYFAKNGPLSVPCYFRTTNMTIFVGNGSSNDITINGTISDDEVVASDVPPRYSGVLIYKSFSDRLVTVVQPGDTNFMGRTAFTRSNFDHLPLFYPQKHFHFFPSILQEGRGNRIR